MSGNERLDSKAGPLGNLSQAYFGGIDNMVKGCEPALKGVGQDHPLILDADCTTCGRCVDVCGKDVFRITTRFNRSES